MTELDQALATLRQDMNDSQHKSAYYDLFLNAVLCMPTDDSADQPEVPLVIDAEGVPYLMLFDSQERLYAWAGSPVPYMEVPGYLLAAHTAEPLHWALNAGTAFSKRFPPAEIAWLREVVEKCQAEAP